MCLYPKFMENRKYTATKKNSGRIPIMTDKRVKMVAIGCGKCIECKKQKANSWRTRLNEDIKYHKNAYFVTLTFSDEAFEHLAKEVPLNGYELDNRVAKKGIRYFLERWRKKHGKSVRHWLVTELGHTGTERVHIHGLIWTDTPEDIDERWNSGKVKYGYTYIGEYVNEKTINYIVKYLMKSDLKHKNYKPIICTSKGIGFDYIGSNNQQNNWYKGEKTDNQYRLNNGAKVSLPIYYRNYIYTEEEREKLWLHMLDKKERYVLGERIDVSKGFKKYDAKLIGARAKNDRLGYGNDKINWDKLKYEMQRKWLMHKAITSKTTMKELKEIKKLGK